MEWNFAPDVKKALKEVIKKLKLTHVDVKRVICFRSFGSSSRARARIWSLPRVWQKALKVPAHYVLEVLSERFDSLSSDDKYRVLIHELLHIPANFSGALLPHRGRGKRIDQFRVEKLFEEFRKK